MNPKSALSADTTEKRLQSVVSTAPISRFAFDRAGVITLSEGNALDDLGLKPGQLVGQSIFDVYRGAPNLEADVFRALAGAGVNFTMVANGLFFDVHFIPFVNRNGEVTGVTGVAHNITEQKRTESVLAGEKRLLEMVAGGCSLREVLEALCRCVEEIASDCHCSVLLVDAGGSHFQWGAAPSLPVAFTEALQGSRVTVEAGPCAMATYLNNQVITVDIASETRWQDWCQLALSHGLRACWSTPILSAGGKVLGSFAILYAEPTAPAPLHQSLIERFIHIASIAIERAESDSDLCASEQVARGQVEALVQSLDVLATAPAPDQFILRMLSTMGRLLGNQWVAVWLWLVDDATDSLVLRAAVRQDTSDVDASDHPFVKDPLFWKEDGGLQELFFTGVPIAYDDVNSDPRIRNALRAYFRSQGARKILGLPLLVGGKVKGFITICHAQRPPYQPAEIELAQALAHQVMLAIQSRQAATLEERNRMARDIHDTLAQGFTAIVVQLQAAEDASARGLMKDAQKHLQSARDLARQSLIEARRSVHALRPQALEGAFFWDALKRMIRQSTAGTPLHTKFRMRGHPRDLPPLWQQNLLHIGQEALTNTLKHARASRFEARLDFNKKDFRLELEDNGEGFTTTDCHDGFGLTGMRERVEQIGGTLTVTSSPNQGTKVIVVSRYAGNDAV